ncbi:MAG: hypothetical protein ACRCXT_00990 [Paraclostridium sp.]
MSNVQFKVILESGTDLDCSDCDFTPKECRMFNSPYCSGCQRKDNKDVIFKIVYRNLNK